VNLVRVEKTDWFNPDGMIQFIEKYQSRGLNAEGMISLLIIN